MGYEWRAGAGFPVRQINESWMWQLPGHGAPPSCPHSHWDPWWAAWWWRDPWGPPSRPAGQRATPPNAPATCGLHERESHLSQSVTVTCIVTYSLYTSLETWKTKISTERFCISFFCYYQYIFNLNFPLLFPNYSSFYSLLLLYFSPSFHNGQLGFGNWVWVT